MRAQEECLKRIKEAKAISARPFSDFEATLLAMKNGKGH